VSDAIVERPSFRFVRIVWLDAYSEDEWRDVDTYEMTDYVVESFGYLVKETKNYHLIAPNLGRNDGRWEAGCMMGIPKKMVLEIDDFPNKEAQ
jgi:hypothetical protein